MPSKTFIVRLPAGSTDEQVYAAAKKAEEKGWTVGHKYTATIKGFSVSKDIDGDVSAQEVELQSVHDGVEIEADSIVTTQ